jgi:hypothetical protein
LQSALVSPDKRLKDLHYFDRGLGKGGFCNGSINDVLLSLVREGLEPVLGYIQAALDKAVRVE